MKRLLRIRALISCLVSILFFLPFSSMFAQSGTWIEQVFQPTMSGNWLADRGDNCLGYTKQNAQHIYFFDISTSQWTEVDLGAPQAFRDVEASGQTVMAYSDDLIIGYSAETFTWDTVSYEGVLLNPNGSGIQRGYGCGEKLAYFVTDYAFYVFDSELGLWQTHAYFYPGPGTGYFWSGDDYAGVILYLSPQAYPVNMVYSLPLHAFNENLSGGTYYHTDWGMTHGFVTTWYDGVDSYYLTGYSSYTNQFLTETILGSYEGGSCFFPEHFVEKTIGVFHYMETLGEARLLAYDTQQGGWYEASHYFDPQYYTNPGVWHYGGRVAGSAQGNSQTRENTYLFFDGARGSFNTITPGIHNDQGVSGYPNAGGDLLMAYDTTTVWFFNPANQHSHFVNTPWRNATGFYLGDHFITIGSYERQNSPVAMHIYNSSSDNVTNITTGTTPAGCAVVGSPHMCGFTAGAGLSEVYLYSGLLDACTNITYPPNSYPSVTVQDHLAVVSTSSQSYLYDATSNSLHSASYQLLSRAIGEDVVLIKKSGSAIDAYSTRFQQLTELAVPEGVYGLTAGGNVGLVSTPGYSKYYAYNGFYNNLVPLQPSGQWQGSMVGKNTALVVQVDRIYAFDPQAVTGFVMDQRQPGEFHLAQNYPNPFNPTTTITYQLPAKSWVTLKMYDVLGREVATPVNEVKQPGTYAIEFEASALASGIYFYQLRSGSFIETKKLLLLR